MTQLFELTLSVQAISRELERLSDEVMRPLGLTGAQADALLVIDSTAPLSLKALGELLIAQGDYPSRLVDRLVAAGLVQRRTAAGDRRRVELTLTAQGRTTAAKVREARHLAIATGAEVLGSHDLDGAIELLRVALADTPFEELIRRRVEMY